MLNVAYSFICSRMWLLVLIGGSRLSQVLIALYVAECGNWCL